MSKEKDVAAEERVAASAAAKTVLLTGCSSGIGLLAARLFARKGWNVVATARRPESLAEFADQPHVLTVPLDVRDEASIQAAVRASLARFGQIDVLVNNAGYGLFGPLEGAAHGELEAQFATNVFGAAAMMRAVLPSMRERRDGVIVNISSVAGHVDFPFGSAYIATKFALNGLSSSARHELALFNIRVKLVEPGAFKTNFVAGSLEHTEHPAYAGPLKNFLALVERADRSAPTPEPVAEAIYRAATDGSRRLHYPVRGRGVLLAKRWLPDLLYRKAMQSAMTRKPR